MKILIADDHTLFRDTLQHYIERAQPRYALQMVTDLSEVVGVMRSGQHADLCILDFKMPGMKGLDSLEELIATFPQQKFAVMSGLASPDDIKSILALNVMGFLPKTMPGRVMLMAIDAMLNGRKYRPFLQEAIQAMPYNFKNRIEAMHGIASRMNNNVHLTPREKDVLQLLCVGKSNKDIAGELNLKIVTIKLHIRGIFRKLECDNRTRAVIKARELGIFG